MSLRALTISFNNKVNVKDVIPNFVCVLTNLRYRYSLTFKFYILNLHAFLKKQRRYYYRLCSSVCPLCYLLLNHWTKSNQIRCVNYSHCNSKFNPAPLEGSKGQISLSFNNKVNFKDFYTKLCVCSYKLKIQVETFCEMQQK